MSFSSFLGPSDSLFCFIISELNLFFTVCSVRFSSAAYSDHFLPER